MTIVDCAVYEGGQRRGHLASRTSDEACHRDGAFVWMGLYEPTREEFDSVSGEFGLHELAVEDAIKAYQRPKLERYGDVAFLVVKTARYVEPDDDRVRRDPAVHRRRLRAVGAPRRGGADGWDPVEARGARRSFLSYGPMAVVYAILDEVVDAYAPVMDALDRDIEEVEEEVFAGDRRNPAQRIYELKREAIEFARAVDSAGRADRAHDDGHDARAGRARDLLPRRARPPDPRCRSTSRHRASC